MRMYGHNRSWIRIRIRIVTTEVGSVFFVFRVLAALQQTFVRVLAALAVDLGHDKPNKSIRDMRLYKLTVKDVFVIAIAKGKRSKVVLRSETMM